MSFKGRSFVGCGAGSHETHVIDGGFTDGDHMLDISTINSVPLAVGSEVFVKYNIINAVLNFGFYETANGVIIDPTTPIFINPRNMGYALAFKLVQPTANGLCVLCRHTHQQYDIVVYVQRGRFVGNEAMEDPLKIMEHVLRLQTYGNRDTFYTYEERLPTEYSDYAKIKLSGEGSFDAPALATIRQRTVARQIFNENDAYTDEIVKFICREFFLINYQDENGFECVKYLLDPTPSNTTILYSHIVGKIGKLDELRAQDVFCEPVVNYAYDYATGKYTKQLRVSKVTNENYAPDSTSGFVGADGETVWNRCKQLYDIVKQVEPMPSSISNLKWVVTYNDALWYITNLMQWLGKRRVSFTIPYSIGNQWNIGKKINIRFPHQTRNYNVECVIEEIRKSKNRGVIDLKVVLITEELKDFETYIIEQPEGDLHEESDVDFIES